MEREGNGSGADRLAVLFLSSVLAGAFFIHSCAKTVNPLDPDQYAYFLEEPCFSAGYAGSLEFTVKLNRPATLYYVTVPAGSQAPTAEEVRNGRAAGGGTPLAAASYPVTGNSAMGGAQLLMTNTSYAVFVVAESSGGALPGVLSKVYQINGTSSSAYAYQAQFALTSAHGAASDLLGNIYVTAYGNMVYKYSKNGDLIRQWGGFGSGDGQFNSAKSVACDRNGHVYVVDDGNMRVQKFDSNGNFILKWGSNGSGDGQFVDPNGVAVDPSGRFVYVSDGTDDRIQKFTSNGVYLLQWGGSGAGNGQFNQPNQVAVDPAGCVYVADFFNNRVQKFSPDGSFVWTQAVPDVVSVFADDACGIYYCISHTEVQKRDTNGVFITSFGSFGAGDGQFNTIHDMTVDVFGNIWVSDSGLARYQKFR